VQVSCAGSKDTMSGLDLARDGHGLLWFVPVLMGALILSAIVRIRREQNKAFALASTLCGLLTAYLMNRERLRVHDESGLISAQLTGWFWLGFISTFAVAISGIAMLVRRQHAT
jgi:predicted branched-subunit amino acid permease